MAARHKEEDTLLKEKVYIHIFSCAQRCIDPLRRGVEGHRSSGDATGELVWKPAISFKQSWGGGGGYYRRTTKKI